MSRGLRLRLLVSLLLCVTGPHVTAAHGGTNDPHYLALLGGTLVDGTGAEPVDNAAVVIRDQRILYAGPRADIEIPTSATVLDVGGMTVLPGLINAHVHRGLNAANLRAWARAGVTTVRDLGSSASALALFRDIYPPDPERARLVAAGPLITVPGGYPIVPFGGGSAAPVGSLQDARDLAEDLLDDGADLLKLALETGTVFGRQIPVLSLEQARLLARIAHGRGTVASAHVTAVVDLDLALDAGVDDLAHMVVDRAMPEETLQRVVDQGVYWVPTLELWQCAGPLSIATSNLRRFAAAGGKVALGTDYAGYTCSWELGMPITEIELMRSAGMTADQIVVAATKNAAHVCNLERELGTLEKGKIADILVVAGDPLVDLNALQDVRLVIHDGVPIRNELPSQLPPPPRRVTRRVGSK